MKKAVRLGVTLLVTSILSCLLFSTAVGAKSYYGNDDKGYYWTYDDETKTIRYDVGKYEGQETNFYKYHNDIKRLVLADEIEDCSNFNYFSHVDTVTLGKRVNLGWKGEGRLDYYSIPYQPKEFIVDKDNPNLETYDGALYSENFEILYAVPARKESVKIHPKCKTYAADLSVLTSFEVSADHPYFSVYDGALYSKDYTKLLAVPKNKEVLKLHVNMKEADTSQRPSSRYEVSDKSNSFSVYEGMLYSKDYKTLYSCPTGKKTFTFHSNLKIVGQKAFQYMSFENPVVFPVGVTTLRENAFFSCDSLINGSIVLPDTLVNLESTRYTDPFSGKCTVIYSKRNTAFPSGAVSDEEFSQYYQGTTTGGKWQTFSGTNYSETYYITAEGKRASGWTKIKSDWYYFEPVHNVLQKGFQYIDGKAYFLGTTGARAHDKWMQNQGKWYYLNSWGAGVVNCWRKSGGKWYYLQADGVMATNQWVKDYGKWYYVGKDGAMYANRKTPDGNYVNSSGVRVS